MLRVVAAALTIYIGALVSASSYLSASPYLTLVNDEDAASASAAAPVTTVAPAPLDKEVNARRAFASLPVAFVANAGQFDSRVYYHARGDRYAFYLTRGGVTLAFLDRTAIAGADTFAASDRGGHALELRFADANPLAVPQGEARLPGDVNYFRGSDATQWHAGLGRYARIIYRDVWPGIDVRMFEHGGVLKYEFLVHPGAKPEAIRLAYAGASGLTVDQDGALRIDTSMGALQDSAPESYQTIGGARVPVDSRYALDATAPPSTAAGVAERRFGFAVGNYRRDVDLVIDPGVRYATFLGGTNHETATSIQIHAAGNAIITGTTQSPNFRRPPAHSAARPRRAISRTCSSPG